MVEQIDAKLENRPYDNAKIAGAMAIGMAANMGKMADQMDEAAARFREQDAKNMSDAYANEGRDQSGWSNNEPEPAFGEPMYDPSN